VTFRRKELHVWDHFGTDAVLFHHSTDDDGSGMGGLYVEQAQMWFDSMWNSVSRDYTP
jgi:hypothetical protein